MTRNTPSTQNETVRLFQSNFLEFFTRVHPSVPAILYLPLILYLFYRAFSHSQVSGWVYFLFFLMGILTWSITEYFLHRFVFHFEAKSDFSKRCFYLFHGIHHDYPNDAKRLVMPPAVSLPVAVLLILLLFGKPLGEAFGAGFGLGYLAYDLSHYFIHHHSFRFAFFQRLKRYHLRHHFQDPKKAYGVSSPFWDHVFKTAPVSEAKGGRA